MAESADVKKEAAASTAANATLAQIRSFAAGGVGGVCAVVVGHPFDLVKVRLQTAQPGVYKGAVDVVRRTVAREGLLRVSISLSYLYILSLLSFFWFVCLLTSVGPVCRRLCTARRRHPDVYVPETRS